jgi:protein-tyrosine phosphatase
MMQRHIQINGINNLRDLGGYATQDGGQTRWGVFLRSANLDEVAAAGQRQLLDYGLRHIIDLRTTFEIQRWPDVFAQSSAVNYHHLPFFDDNPGMEDIDGFDDVVEIYTFMVERCQPAVRTILETISTADDGAVLFHCAGGKDRTGIIAALLLGLAGVDDATIAQDYFYSAS